MRYTASDIAAATKDAAKAYPRYFAYVVDWTLLSVAAIVWFAASFGWIYVPIIVGILVVLSLMQRLSIRFQAWLVRRDEADQ